MLEVAGTYQYIVLVLLHFVLWRTITPQELMAFLELSATSMWWLAWKLFTLKSQIFFFSGVGGNQTRESSPTLNVIIPLNYKSQFVIRTMNMG